MVAPQSHVDQSAELLQSAKLLLSVSPEVDPLRQSSNGRGKVFEEQPSGVFGALGLFMKAYDWPRVPLLIGMVLGEIVEPNFFISVQVYGASWLWQRPIVLATLVVMLAFLLTMLVRRARGRAQIRGGGADA